MRFTRTLALILALNAFTGCRRSYTVPETPMPHGTVLLSQMMRQLSARPGFTQALLSEIDKGSSKGPVLLTPALVDELRKRILGGDWRGLDRFPGWTMRAINPTVRVAGQLVGKDKTPGTTARAEQYLDVGPYKLNQSQIVPLDKPSTLAGFTTDGLISDLGDGVTHGDGANLLAPEHAASQRLADILNRLAANRLDDVAAFSARTSTTGDEAKTPEDLILLLQQSGHTVAVDDARYFANFTHLHYNGLDVMAPFWVDTRMVIPKSGGRHLLIPAAHAEYEWRVRGPLVNADVSYYFGIDGKAEWRTMDTLDQPWVLRRAAHTYTGPQAVEVTRLADLMTAAYMRLHAAHPALPFGGYYALGVCQDGVSAIEQRMTGHVTLFPNTADADYFTDPRDAEINALFQAIPKDRDGTAPTPERVFGSIPTAPTADADHAYDAVTIPGLATDLNVTYAAWQTGTPRHAHGWWFYGLIALGASLALGAAVTGVRSGGRSSS